MTKKGYKQTKEHSAKIGAAQLGKKHPLTEEGRRKVQEANFRRRGKPTKKKLRIEIICPVCGEKLETYINKQGKKQRTYHRECWLVQLGRNSGKANLAQTPQSREKHKASILRHYQENPQTAERIRQKVIEYFQNPIHREHNKDIQILTHSTPEYRQKARQRMLNWLAEAPERFGNSRLRRDKMTSIEKIMSEILWELNMFAVWNAPVRTNMGTKFPDFTLIPPIVIQCDGEYWHMDSISDARWDEALASVGYNVLRFSGKEIKTSPEETKKIVTSAYQKYLLGQRVYRSYRASTKLIF